MASPEGNMYRTIPNNDTHSYRATSSIAAPESAKIGGNGQSPVDNTIYVLKQKTRSAFGGSKYQEKTLKQYLGVDY